MRLLRWIALICCALPVPALALYCPMNNNFINVGDSIQSVEKACGKPTSMTKVDDSDIISGKWIYHRNDGGIGLVEFTIDHGHVSKITLDNKCMKGDAECTPSSEEIDMYKYGCDQIIYVGNNTAYLKRFCGAPFKTVVLDADYHVTQEYYYAKAKGDTTLIFENGALLDSK